MYQLLMAGYDEWPANRGTMGRSRTFEHTDESIVGRFKVGGALGTLDVNAVRALPAIFCGETNTGLDNQCARVGTILNVTSAGTDYQISYTYDEAIPPIPNSKLEEMAIDLGIDRWEFSRTHWAIKEVDLFQVLYRHGLGAARKPQVFGLASAIDDDLVSVMMPFSGGFTPVYQALTGAAAGLGMRCQRADDIWDHHTIIQDVVSLISKAKVVICDLSGKNPNVFYEAGIAHAIGAEVILLTQHHDDVPFDLRHIRYITYLNNGEGLATLAAEVQRRLTTVTGRHPAAAQPIPVPIPVPARRP